MSDFETLKSTAENELTVCKIRTVSHHKEVASDFVLPDYMGDVKRVLKSTACVIPCNKLISANEASFLAIVTFKVTYLDSENTLTEASFSAELELPEKGNACVDAGIEYGVQSVGIRLVGPRKINAKAMVVCNISLIEGICVCDSAEFDGAEILKKDIEIHAVEYLKCAEREYAEEMDRIEERLPDEIEVVKSSAEAFIDGIHKTDGGVNLSGYVDAFCILRSEEENFKIGKRIPIEEHIECELYDNEIFIPSVYVTGVNVNINAINAEDECAVSIVMNMNVECEAAHHYGKMISVVTDAFFEGCKNECLYECLEFESLGDCVFDKASYSATFERGEEPIYDVMEREAVVKNLRYERTGADLIVCCDIEINAIVRGDGAENLYSIKEKTEFSKKYRLSANKNEKISVNVTPCDVSLSFDGEKTYLDMEMLVSVIAATLTNEKTLQSIASEKEENTDTDSVIVYYPEKDESLWSVSKKYAVASSKIAAVNGLENDSIEGVKKIIVIK